MNNFWRFYYAFFGTGSFVVPSLVLAYTIKSILSINIPILIFLIFPIYLGYIGFRFGNTDSRKIFSHNLTGWYIISLIYFFCFFLAEANTKFSLFNHTFFASIICVMIYIVSIWFGIIIGRSIASHDKTIDWDTIKNPGDYVGWWKFPIRFH